MNHGTQLNPIFVFQDNIEHNSTFDRIFSQLCCHGNENNKFLHISQLTILYIEASV